MPESVPLSLIHPEGSQFLPVTYLLKAPIDCDALIERLEERWGEKVNASWDQVDENGHTRGDILHYNTGEVLVMISPVSGSYTANYPLPDHNYHLRITAFCSHGDPLEDEYESYKRKREASMKSAVALSKLLDCLAHEPASLGLLREDAGTIVPPQAIVAHAERIREGEFPTGLWVAVRAGGEPLHSARTFGLPTFSHLDIEILESAKSAEEIAAHLENIAEYLLAKEEFLLPGQSLNGRQLMQGVSPIDDASVLHLNY